MMTETTTKKEKLKLLEQNLPEFKDMLNSFMSAKEDEAFIMYLVAQSCSQKVDLLGPCFYLIIQLLYSPTMEVVHEEAILNWVASAKKKIEEAPDSVQAEEDKEGEGEIVSSEKS